MTLGFNNSIAWLPVILLAWAVWFLIGGLMRLGDKALRWVVRGILITCSFGQVNAQDLPLVQFSSVWMAPGLVSGTNAVDHSGLFKLNPTSGAAAFPAYLTNNVWQVSGTNYLICSTTAFAASNTRGSVMALVKLTSSTVGCARVFNSTDEALNSLFWFFNVTNGNVQISNRDVNLETINNESSVTGTAGTNALVLNQWALIGASSDGTNAALYVNGVSIPVATNNAIGELSANGGRWIGSISGRDNLTAGAWRLSGVTTYGAPMALGFVGYSGRRFADGDFARWYMMLLPVMRGLP